MATFLHADVNFAKQQSAEGKETIKKERKCTLKIRKLRKMSTLIDAPLFVSSTILTKIRPIQVVDYR